METFRFAFRLLRRNPRFSAAATLILALGISVNTAMFSIVSGVLLRPLPFPAPSQLVALREIASGEDGRTTGVFGAGSEILVSGATLDAWEQQRSLIDVQAWIGADFILTGDEPVVVQGAAVTAGFFAMLGAPLPLGRAFLAEEDVPNAPRRLIIGHALWQRRFGGAGDVIGRTLTIASESFTIIGVAPEGFDFPGEAQMWTTLATHLPADVLRLPQVKVLNVIGRLQGNTTRGRAEAVLGGVAATVPGNDGWSARAIPLRDLYTAGIRPALAVLMAAVMLVLLIACANVGNLQLARGTARNQELAVRAALGAGRARIARELFAESMVIGLAAGVVGTIASIWATRLLLRLSPGELPQFTDISIDYRVLLFAIAASLGTGLLAGLAPVLRLARNDLSPSLRVSGRHPSTDRAGGRMRGAFVIAEVALSVVLLASAGLLVRSFIAIINVDPGFDAERVTTFDLQLPNGYNGPRLWHFPTELTERVEALAGVSAASTTRYVPITGGSGPSPVIIEGRETDAAKPPVQTAAVAPGYFRTMSIHFIAGRDFDARDFDRGLVGIVNQTFVDVYFPNEDPIGRRAALQFGGGSMREIVGVVADVHQTGLMSQPEPMFYTLATQDIGNFLTLVVQSDLPVESLAPAVRAAVREIDPDLPISNIATMTELLSRSIARPRFQAVALSSFAVLAAALAIIGLYTVISQSVTQRRYEIGIRMALGARGADVVGMMLREGLRLSLIGAALGLTATFAATRFLSTLLFGVQPGDPTTLVGVTLLLLTCALVATLVPAGRAARVDPVKSL